ncbi:VOC family protein [Phenylobacterium sp.]|jgi:catechol 2,3-dioxygenase-like lactoylglutathione lyase family enzyme|uniref:VOC family protein n=1 Tax=Phenylobacterium sp. TaxID=1871053 RepID=UPI0008D323FB|nr:VOC family protein [Phenylobacterium sp.]MBA4795135.1 VOC family protein [Phenylobacterium sp.]OHB35849.1 MAG: lactoylglutathione lyase [Phenylobacterium sp. RIFCSPHIGHO2_01_FULL_70_10]
MNHPPTIGYVTLGAEDHGAAQAFYDAVLATLGLKRQHEFEGWTGYGREGDASGQSVWICKPFDGQPARAGNGVMLGFYAQTPDVVDAFYAAAMANGGTDEGAPGMRPHYGDGWYAAYVRDPQGNKLACVRPPAA